MSLASNNLIKNISSITEKTEKTTRLATVTQINDEKIYLTFYGETEQSCKPTKRLSSYNAAVGDIVVVQNINNSYVITGKVV